jgi:hypothetical protein
LNDKLFGPTIKATEVSIIVFALYDSIHEITKTVDTVGRVFETRFYEARRALPTILYIVGEEIEPVEERGNDSVSADVGLVSRLEKYESATRKLKEDRLILHAALLWK